MKGILITSTECPPCTAMREQFSDLIARGEIVEKSFEEEPEYVADLIAKHGVDIPSLLIISDDGELIMSL